MSNRTITAILVLFWVGCNGILLQTMGAAEPQSTGLTHPYVEVCLLGSWIPPTRTQTNLDLKLSTEANEMFENMSNNFDQQIKAIRNSLYVQLPFHPESFPNARDMDYIKDFLKENERIKLEYCSAIDELLEPDQQTRLLLSTRFGRVFQIDPMIESYLQLDQLTKARMTAIENRRIEKYIKHTHEYANYWKTKFEIRKSGKVVSDKLAADGAEWARKQKEDFHCVAWEIFIEYLDVLTPEQQTKVFNFCGYGVRSPDQALRTFEPKVRNILGDDSRADKILEKFRRTTEVIEKKEAR